MSDFTFEMSIHEEGIIMVRMVGVFDFDIWHAKRQMILDTGLSGVNLHGRPSVVDLSMSDPPPGEWKTTFLRIHQELTRVGEGTGPIAVVLGNKSMKYVTARLFTEIIAVYQGPAPHIIPFSTFDEALNWVMKNDSWRNDLVD